MRLCIKVNLNIYIANEMLVMLNMSTMVVIGLGIWSVIEMLGGLFGSLDIVWVYGVFLLLFS